VNWRLKALVNLALGNKLEDEVSLSDARNWEVGNRRRRSATYCARGGQDEKHICFGILHFIWFALNWVIDDLRSPDVMLNSSEFEPDVPEQDRRHDLFALWTLQLPNRRAEHLEKFRCFTSAL
jgi:hypothetical protein